MYYNLFDMFYSPVFMSVFISWALAQFLKMFFTGEKVNGRRKVKLSMLLSSGGMPSSHSSAAMGVTVSIGLTNGFTSAIFVLALVFTLIVMYDAAGVRRETGRQAEIIKDMVEKFFTEHEQLTFKKLKELIGHKPIEVLMGAFLGIAVAIVYCIMYFNIK